jgi:allophanate hydrolase
MGADSLDLGISALRTAYRDGTLKPAEVAERVHAAASASSERTRAWITLVDLDELLARARALEESRAKLPLYGIPFAVKDNIDIAGERTTAGCPSFGKVARRSATVVERLLAAGALPIGKTNMDQFATGLVGTRSPYGACASVYDARYVSGGSSSGSAVAVADGTVSFALGTDTAGSGRVPAAFNGIVGLKPTRGLVSTAGTIPACRSLDCVSLLAAEAGDARRVLAAAAGPDPADPLSRGGRRPPGGAAGAPLRLGVAQPAQLEFFGDPKAAAAWAKAVDQADTVADEVVAVDVEPLLAAGRLLYEGPWVAERYAAVGGFLERGGEGIDPVVRDVILDGARWSAADAFRAQGRLAGHAAAAAGIWERVDTLLLPTTPTIYRHVDVAADPVGTNSRLGLYTNFVNLLDLCAVAVPAGAREDGLPFGVSLIAPAFSDGRLLDLAARWPGPDPRAQAAVDLAVCGAHLSGQPLNGELRALGARLLRTTVTAPRYRLYALGGPGPARPGLVRAGQPREGARIEVEIWRLGAAALGSLATRVRPPLAIGNVELEGGDWVRGFVCEGHGANGARDITVHGGWRGYLAAQ